MGRGANQQGNGEVQSAPKPYTKKYVGEVTWDEIKLHDGRQIKNGEKIKEKWLVVEDQVYDITDWCKRHPGGFKVISHFAGQDGTVSNFGWAKLPTVPTCIHYIPVICIQ